MSLAVLSRAILPTAATLDNLAWRNNQWTGADCTAVGVDPYGRVLAFCGDTYTDGNPNPATPAGWDSSHFTNNSLLVWHGGMVGARFRGGRNLFGSPNPWVPSWVTSPTVGGFRWPSGAAWIDWETDGKLHAVYTGYQGNIFTGYTPHHTMEVTVTNNLDAINLSMMPGLDPVQVGGKWIEWGKAVVTIDGFHHIFGAKEAASGSGRRPVLARRAARLGSLPGNVPTYWDGGGWNASVSAVAELSPEVGNVWTVNLHPSGGLMMTGNRLGLLTNEVHMWTAATPTGTWTDQGTVFTPPAVFTGQYSYSGCGFVTGRTYRCAYNLNGTAPQLAADYRYYGLRWTDIAL